MLFLSLLLSFIVAVILLIHHWSQNKGIIYLVVTIILYSLRQFTFLIINSNAHGKLLSILFLHFDPLFFLMGPFILYYLKSLIRGKLVADRYLLLHTLPAVLILINLLPYYASPFASKVIEMTQGQGLVPFLSKVSEPYLLFPLKYQRILMVVYNLTYVIAAFRLLLRFKRSGTTYIKKKLSALINRILWVLPAFILPHQLIVIYSTLQAPEKGILVYHNTSFTSDGPLFFLTLILPLSFLFVPSWLYGDQSITSTGDILIHKIAGLFQKKRGEVNEEAYSEKSTDLERIIAFIEQEKPFLQVGFTLHDLSQELNIPYIRVINCFKKELNTSFPAYRKKLRIAHAISLMRAGAHLTISIDGIAERAGFKSKSIFYTAFKEEHGMTPTEWMKKNL